MKKVSIRERRRREREAREATAGDLPNVDAVIHLTQALGNLYSSLTLEEMNRLHVRTVLERMGGNRAAAARALGIDVRTLAKWARSGREEG